jgi:hypothetical protein
MQGGMPFQTLDQRIERHLAAQCTAQILVHGDPGWDRILEKIRDWFFGGYA